MKQEQLTKILKSINNRIKSYFITNEEIIDALSESDYLIPINISIDGGEGTRFSYIKITDDNGGIVLEQEFDDSQFNSNIYVTQDVAHQGLQIHIVHNYYGYFSFLLMNDLIVSEGIDYEYIRTEDNNKAITDITLLEVTGDIDIEILTPPPS